jgi:tyrosine-specific transport protein
MNQRTLGATLIVAGTTIGAGMLAQPMTSSGFGYCSSIILLIGMWVYMLISAGITVEISGGVGQSIAVLAEKKLGRIAKYVAASSMLVLFWSLLWCYISGGSSILHQGIVTSIPIPFVIVAFTVVFGLSVATCTAAVDYSNRFIFLIKIVVLVVILSGLISFVRLDNLFSPSGKAQLSLHHVIPVFFTAYGFHGSIPFLIKYLDGDKKSIYTSLILGSMIPLVVYIIWQTVTLGIIGNSLDGTEDVGLFIHRLTTQTGHSYLTILTNAFAFLAIVTSFLGVALGLFDYISEWFKTVDILSRIKITTLTFGLPLILALIYPDGFIMALGCAAVALSILAVVLPCLIALKQSRGVQHNQSFWTSLLLNKALVVLILLGGIAVIAIEVMLKS